MVDLNNTYILIDLNPILIEIQIAWKYWTMITFPETCSNSDTRFNVFVHFGGWQQMIQHHWDCVLLYIAVAVRKYFVSVIYDIFFYLESCLLYSQTKESKHWLDPIDEHSRTLAIRESRWSFRSSSGLFLRKFDRIPTSFIYSTPSSSGSRSLPIKSRLLKDTDRFFLPLMVTSERRAGLVLTKAMA